MPEPLRFEPFASEPLAHIRGGQTLVHNRTDDLCKIKEGNGDVYRDLTTLRPGEKYRIIWLDIDVTYKFEGDRECGFGGGRDYYIILSSDDYIRWESIDLVPSVRVPGFTWEGITVRTTFKFRTVWKTASGKLEAVARFSEELEKDLKRVVIYRAQCAHLVQFCSERVLKIRETFSLLSHIQMLWKYEGGNLEKLANHHLNDLLCALLSAQELLKGCGQKEWRRAALVLSLPPSDPQNLEKYSGSKFFLVIRELGWSFDLVQRSLGGNFRYFEWDDGRDKYVLWQRNQLENGVAIDEMELLQGDRDREILDHKELLSDKENGSIVKDSFSISLAGWLWYNFLIALAGWFWYDFFISLAGWLWYTFPLWNFAATIQKWCLARWLWYTFPLWNFAATIQKWCLAGCSWYNSSHVKFAATIQNRCQNQNFEIDDLDLRKKKFIGRGGFKEVHKGKWLGLKVAIATFKLPDSTSRSECEGILNELRKEVEFMVTLYHPNVVDFFGYAIQKDQRTAFLVMELMEEDLGHLIKRNMKLQQKRRSDFGGVFSLSVTVDILMQIVEAMIHSHKHQVMYRDLKPGNCLVSKKAAPRSNMDVHYTVKMIDFGNSKLWDLESVNTYLSGTSHYMAPEARDFGNYTYSVDIYSFGMLCFEVITGIEPLDSPPFNPWSAKKNFDRLRRGERPVIPANCPGSLSDLMRKCWAATPTDRPTFKAIQRDLWDFKLLEAQQYVPRPRTS